jgi:hypothetical protein
MAIIKNGPNGQVSVKIGSIDYINSQYGKYVRSLPSVSKTRKNTPNQLITHERLRQVQAIVTELKMTIRKGFTMYNLRKRAHDNAMSYNLANATLKYEGGYILDWTKFAIAKGYPNPLLNPVWTLDTLQHELYISWAIDTDIMDKFHLDQYTCQVVLIAMDEQTNAAASRMRYNFH